MANINVVTIEGNIGAGKTTLLQKLSELGYEILAEPVEEWVRSGALQDFYQGKMDAFTFQLYVLVTRVQGLRNKISELSAGSTLVVERGFLGDW